MADEPTGTEPVVDPTEPVDGGQTDDPQPADQEEPKLNKTQLQQISSIMGNQIKNLFDEKISPVLEHARQPAQTLDTSDASNPAVTKFNEDLQEMILSGNVTGAFEKYLSVKEKANQNLSQKQKTALNKEMGRYQENDHYKEIFPDMQKKAQDYIKEGYPPGPAAKLAYSEALVSHMKGGDTPNLGMAGGGRRTTPDKSPKLPEKFKKAYLRDKEKGLFKDEQDFINHLSPNVRAQHGI